MDVTSFDKLEFCDGCLGIRGLINEKYNDDVPVVCNCIIRDAAPTPNPSIVCTFDFDQKVIRLYWKPRSQHLLADGGWSHTPFFGGPPPYKPGDDEQRNWIRSYIREHENTIVLKAINSPNGNSFEIQLEEDNLGEQE
jgi:hypothetical protein